MNGAKSAILMEKVRLGLPGKCHKWGAGPSLWWHTVPCPCRSHWKGVVAKGSPTSQRHLQCRGVSTAKTAKNDDLWCRHTTGTGFAQGCVTSEAPAAMELCVLTSGASRQVEWPHSARTAVDPAGIQRYPQGPRYTDPTEWWLVFESVSARRAEGETIAHYGSGSVLQNSDDVGAPASHQHQCWKVGYSSQNAKLNTFWTNNTTTSNFFRYSSNVTVFTPQRLHYFFIFLTNTVMITAVIGTLLNIHMMTTLIKPVSPYTGLSDYKPSWRHCPWRTTL